MYELKAKKINGVKTIDSRDVAQMVERDHDALLKTIRTYQEYLVVGNSTATLFSLKALIWGQMARLVPATTSRKKVAT